MLSWTVNSIMHLRRKTFYSEIEKINYKTLEAIYDIDDSYNKLLLRSNCLIS